jgi:hypothetical protein
VDASADWLAELVTRVADLAEAKRLADVKLHVSQFDQSQLAFLAQDLVLAVAKLLFKAVDATMLLAVDVAVASKAS